MLITNLADIARHAEDAGVDTIFVDLEKLGKVERQGPLNTVKSDHSIADIAAVREVVRNAEVMVRTNPLHDGSVQEIEDALAAGADCLMLPMFETADDVRRFRDIVNGRALVRPLIETPSAVLDHRALAGLDGIDSYHFGLNDLHIAYGNTFVFEPLADGKLDAAIESFKAAGTAFGIGGVARDAEGVVPGNIVLAEGVRRGSSAVILSRTFHRQATTLDELVAHVDLKGEIRALRDLYKSLAKHSPEEWATIKRVFEEAVRHAVSSHRNPDTPADPVGS